MTVYLHAIALHLPCWKWHSLQAVPAVYLILVSLKAVDKVFTNVHIRWDFFAHCSLSWLGCLLICLWYCLQQLVNIPGSTEDHARTSQGKPPSSLRLLMHFDNSQLHICSAYQCTTTYPCHLLTCSWYTSQQLARTSTCISD